MSLETLLDQYRSVGVDHDGRLLLPFPDAGRFIEECRKAKYTILRMEFWRQGEKGIAATSLPADLSSFATATKSPADRSAKAAAKILALPKPNGETLVSFVVADKTKS
jgi:hypothetical protein